MRSRVIIALKVFIPLFAERPSHPFVPLDHRTAGARSEGQGRPSAGASRVPLTVASTLAGWRRGGERSAWRYAVFLLAGVLALGTGPAVTLAQSAPIMQTVAVDAHAGHIAEASQRFGIPERWIRAVLRAESAGDVRAISSAGAMGLMQVMPDTWAGLRVRYRLGRNPYDPRDNIHAGTAYLREMWDRYGTIAAMLAAYNAGPGRYDEYRLTGRVLPAETRAYVAALTPTLGGAVASETPEQQAAPPPDWRDAPLFVMRPSDRRVADPVQTIGTSGDGRAAVPVRERRNTEPRDGSMFVARAGDGGAP
ncbi:lytic transglycosylase domain-containing protein [Agrobacterium vitis]|uniref:lytic transglycosylase domain-containing protein n=1 Tax=Rhizobium/Agrobacterium group TaxID=227290 RepID=UPI001F386FDE|nr:MULTISPECIES: lytic transglycosylase domain-containing protein [Rhizobium/Agrobacterium group]MCF1501689.1 lytic transglycosylase domain-containing protein [Allorhizobium sp. Av2]MCM2438525.1 lytic transglycosylase domain-containing protein [Agrobacterium vitis]MCM2473139.1 lytic transglycosylase domain-containing protein [Rhizobium sp. CG5]